MQLSHTLSATSCTAALTLALLSPNTLAEASSAGSAVKDTAQEAVDRVKVRLDAALGSEAHTEMLPRWEIGFGALQLNAKDYPASDNDNTRLFVVPYGIYRGEKIRIGDGGISAIAFENPRYSLEFSVAGSVNANSEDNLLREGMVDIDYMFEMGPQLVVTVFDRVNHDGIRSELTLSTQLRAAFSTDFSKVKGRGGVLTTVLEWERGGYMNGRLGVFAELGPKWASEDLQEVFYQVDPEFVTAERSAYDAKGGYLGTDLSIGLSYQPTENIWLYGALGKKLYGGAANEDSPLFETDSSDTFWLGALWRIKSSKELVAVLRD